MTTFGAVVAGSAITSVATTANLSARSYGSSLAARSNPPRTQGILGVTVVSRRRMDIWGTSRSIPTESRKRVAPGPGSSKGRRGGPPALEWKFLNPRPGRERATSSPPPLTLHARGASTHAASHAQHEVPVEDSLSGQVPSRSIRWHVAVRHYLRTCDHRAAGGKAVKAGRYPPHSGDRVPCAARRWSTTTPADLHRRGRHHIGHRITSDVDDDSGLLAVPTPRRLHAHPRSTTSVCAHPLRGISLETGRRSPAGRRRPDATQPEAARPLALRRCSISQP